MRWRKRQQIFSGSTPQIAEHFFYGAVEYGPQYLVIWYLFKTDAELAEARENGLCERLICATKANLLDMGYPEQAFAAVPCPGVDKLRFEGGTEESQQELMSMLTNRSASIRFTTQEDIQREAGGSYRLYFT